MQEGTPQHKRVPGRVRRWYSTDRRGGKEYQEKGLAYNLVKEIAEVDHDIDIWHQVEYHVDPLRSNPNKDMGWALADAQWQSTQAI